MSEILGLTPYLGERCDSCEREERRSGGFTAPVASYSDEARTFRAGLGAAGWRWFASRSVRAYCPNCKPKPGHRMNDITEFRMRPR